MTSRYQVFGLRFALGAALLASACQHDSDAEFDDRNLMSPDVGGSADGGGSNAAAGESSGAASSAGGSEASGGSASQGGKSSAGAAGSASSTAGKGGTAAGGSAAGGNAAGGKAAGGKAGTDAGGSASQAGKAGQGGAAGSASGGMAGSPNPPEPITLETADIDDVHIASCLPQMNFGETKLVMVDGSNDCRYQALIDVPRLELPAGALVSKATLTLTCSNAGSAITVAYANEAWKELMVRWNTRPEVGATIGTITCATAGTATVDLTAAFKAWLSGDHAANGIYLYTEATDGTDFVSSEADKAASRPQLSVTYTLPLK